MSLLVQTSAIASAVVRQVKAFRFRAGGGFHLIFGLLRRVPEKTIGVRNEIDAKNVE
jgi:hypothetical protein